MTLPLASRGYLVNYHKPGYVGGLHPDAQTEDLHPEIMVRSTEAPQLKIDEPIKELKPTIKPRKRKSNGHGRR